MAQSLGLKAAPGGNMADLFVKVPVAIYCFVEMNPAAVCPQFQPSKWPFQKERCRLFCVKLNRYDYPYSTVVRPCKQCEEARQDVKESAPHRTTTPCRAEERPQIEPVIGGSSGMSYTESGSTSA
jgi:hypothetical protein